MNIQEQAGQVSKEELKTMMVKCWSSCNSRAWLEDWTGYRHCLKHSIQSLNYGWGEGRLHDWWMWLKYTKIFI